MDKRPSRPTGCLRRLDKRAGRTGRCGYAAGPWPSLLAGGGLLWVYTIDGQLAIIDPAACRTVIRLTVPQASQPGLVATEYALGALWFARAGELCRVSDTGERTVTELPEPDSPAFFPAAGKSAVWVLDYNGADGISRIDPATNRAVQVRESGGVNDLAAAVGPAPGTGSAG